jgi:hypothetical protein
MGLLNLFGSLVVFLLVGFLKSLSLGLKFCLSTKKYRMLVESFRLVPLNFISVSLLSLIGRIIFYDQGRLVLAGLKFRKFKA